MSKSRSCHLSYQCLKLLSIRCFPHHMNITSRGKHLIDSNLRHHSLALSIPRTGDGFLTSCKEVRLICQHVPCYEYGQSMKATADRMEGNMLANQRAREWHGSWLELPCSRTPYGVLDSSFHHRPSLSIPITTMMWVPKWRREWGT